MGIESDDDLDDHDIYVGFRWFADIHAVMRTRAVVSPPELLDTSAPDMSTLSTPDSYDQQMEPEREWPTEDEPDSDQPEPREAILALLQPQDPLPLVAVLLQPQDPLPLVAVLCLRVIWK